ncbi:NnrU family protein [Pseudooceanicola aestuarii]|uniref:NnrU family protein n=1 Tax=Pseudooceanicola aestuarii TaxID=2697319 RepID=UPI0013D459C6|nr:NnrU family protein [Pseudooceanicola aestuarii]
MFLIALGLVLWTWPHLMNSLTPGLRTRLGDGRAKPLIALSALLGIVLMVIGYRGADAGFVYAPPVWGQHLNNLLMVIAVVFLGAAHSKSRLRALIRHPMLTGVAIWAVAHLLVRGDAASVLLWGGMLAWTLISRTATNRRAHDYVPFAGGSLTGDIRLAVISAVVFAVIVAIHAWLGPMPLPM